MNDLNGRMEELRGNIAALETRVMAEHKTVSSMMNDVMALWDTMVALERESRSHETPTGG